MPTVLLSVGKIIRKPSGHIFIYDIENNLLETPCKGKELRRPFVSGGIQQTLQFTFENSINEDVNFDTNRITYIEYAPGFYEEWPDLGPTPTDVIAASEKFQEIYAYLEEFVFACCCDDGSVNPFPYPSNTYANWLATLNANTLPKGLWIEVTAIPSQPSAIFSLFCTETNAIALGGFGQFLNADWQFVGDYTGVDVFTGTPLTGYGGQWYLEAEYVTIDYNNLVGGSFAPSETITDSVTGATAVIVSDNGSTIKAVLTSPGLVFVTSNSFDNGLGVSADVVAYTNSPLGTGNGLIVIYNGLHYQITSYTSYNGLGPALNSAAYTLLPKSQANMGYILEQDDIEFVFVADWLQYRADKRGNAYRYSQSVDTLFGLGFTGIDLFQWGRDTSYANKCENGLINQLNVVGNIFVNSIGAEGRIDGNILGSSSNIFNNNLGPQGVIFQNDFSIAGNIENNTLGAGNFITANVSNGGSCSFNIFEANGGITNKDFGGANFERNVVAIQLTASETLTALISTTTHQGGFSNQQRTIDITGLTNIDIAPYELVGEYILTSSNAAESINLISNFPTLFPFTLKPVAGLTVTVNYTPIGSLSANDEIVGPTANIILNGDNGDQLTLGLRTISTYNVTMQVDANTNI